MSHARKEDMARGRRRLSLVLCCVLGGLGLALMALGPVMHMIAFFAGAALIMISSVIATPPMAAGYMSAILIGQVFVVLYLLPPSYVWGLSLAAGVGGVALLSWCVALLSRRAP